MYVIFYIDRGKEQKVLVLKLLLVCRTVSVLLNKLNLNFLYNLLFIYYTNLMNENVYVVYVVLDITLVS